MAVTIKDIATAAGVSRGTVDRALNNRSGVNPEVAARIRKLAEDMGFEPSKAGRILAICKQNIKIGCVLPSDGNNFFNDIIAGIKAAEAELSDYNISVEIISIKGYNLKTQIKAIDTLIEHGCTALALAVVDLPEIVSKVNEVMDKGIPVVTVNIDLTDSKRLCYCGCDYVAAGRTAGGMLSLTAEKHLNILVVIATKKHHGHQMRVEGFCSELDRLQTPYTIVETIESEDNAKYGYFLTRKTLDDNPEINAIYIASAGVDGICKAVTDLDRQNQIHLCAFDDMASIRELVEQRILDFTICQEPYMQGYMCIQRLFQYLLSNRTEQLENYITRSTIKIPANIHN